MDEFGETPQIYVWPIDHVEGDPFPEDFMRTVSDALELAGIACERV